jgi:hypothetical protein
MKWIFAVTLSLATAGLAAGCGGLSSAQKQDAANVAGGMQAFSNKTGSGLNPFLDQTPTDPSMGAIPATVKSLYWLSFFQAQERYDQIRAGLQAGGQSDFSPTCTAGTTTDNGVSCTQSCPGSAITDTCTIPDGNKETCNGTTYSFTGATVTATSDFSGLTGTSASNFSGTLNISVGISANVTGGSLTGDNLSCTITIPITFPITSSSVGSISCSNFTCTYKGSSISCSDLQSKFSGGSCTASS